MRAYHPLTLSRLAIVLAALAFPASAQPADEIVSPILTLDREALFAGTLYGQRINDELEAASNELAVETRRIEAALEAEERELTDKRATFPVAEFRALADAFDEKVQALRAERERAQDAAMRQIETAQITFFNRIGPILGELVRERGAIMIVDRRAILLAAADVDITQAAITRIDAVLGDGMAPDGDTEPTAPPPAPATPVDSIPAPDTPPDSGSDTTPAPQEPSDDQ